MRNALITGASRGLGLALATALADAGWNLIIDGRNPAALDSAAALLAQRTTVHAIAGDVSAAAHRETLAAAARELGGLDLVVNNAGILGPSPQPALLDYALDVLAEVYAINVLAPLGVLQSVAPLLRPNATVINISSDAAVEAYPGWGGYGAAKAALDHMSAVLGAERPDLRVLAVDPGDMRTQMHQDAFPGEDISDRPLPEASVPGLLELINGQQPSGRYQARNLRQMAPELRVVLQVSDYPAAVALYRDGLGLAEQSAWARDGGHGCLLDAGSATLELVDAAMAASIDAIEAPGIRSGPVRLALHRGPVASAAERLRAAGAAQRGAIVPTPWGHANVRFSSPDGLDLTLFSMAEEA